jgi:hypothetical protein
VEVARLNNITRLRRIATAAIVASVIFCAPALTRLQAQSFTASLQGNVKDASGAVVPGVTVLLENEATGVRQTGSSNESGHYYFTAVPGSYKLTAEMTGFATVVRAGLVLQVQQQASVDLVLTPGDLATTVTVQGETPRLDAISATLGRVVDNASVLNMPLGSRNALDLAVLTPGVSGSTGFTGSNFFSNGSRNSQSDVLIDGVTDAVQEQNGGVSDVKFRPSVEGVQEFKVQTNSFSAEYGNTGGTVVNIVMRSGTNDLHGSVYEFLRNSALNANTFFSNRSGGKIVPFRRNQFGAAAGGPVFIPRLYNGRDRTFFFVNYEGTRQSSQQTTLDTVPSLLERQGDFSNTRDSAGRLITIYDPFSVHKDPSGNYTRDAFPGNVIPAARIDPVAAYVMKFYPAPNLPGNAFTHVNNFFNSGARTSNEDQFTTKVDHNFSGAQRLSARYSQDKLTTVSANLWGNWMNPYDDGPANPLNLTHNGSADYTWTISPTTILNVRWGVARQWGIRTPFCQQCPEFKLSDFGFQGPIDTMIPPNFQPQGYQALGTRPQARVLRGEDVNHFVANLTKVIGGHTLKVGGDDRIYRLNYAQPGWTSLSFNFSSATTMQNPFASNSLQGNGLASMLLGWGSSGSQNTGAYSSWASESYGWFLQDDWHVTNRLSLNLGLRYELDIPRVERYNRVSWIDLGAPSPISAPGFTNLHGGLVFANGNNRAPYDTDTNNFAPRLGFAYQFAPRMVVRGGWGIYYALSDAQNRSALGQGFTTSTTWNASLDNNLTQYAPLSRPFPDGISQPPGSSLGLLSFIGRGISGPIRSWGTKPYYEQWSFSIERELPADSVAEIAYSGNHGVHLYFGDNTALDRIDQSLLSLGSKLNELVPNPFYGVITDPLSPLSQPTVQRIQLLRPYPQFTSISASGGPPNGNAIYHAIQFKFTKRYSHGLDVSAHYTFAKMIDDSPANGNVSWLGYDTGGIQSYQNTRLERSLSEYDVRHRVVADFAYQLPVGHGKPFGANMGWADWILGGWQVNGIVTLQSGLPLVPSLANQVLPDATQRPNLLFDPSLTGPITDRLNRYLNPAAFAQPAPYTLGNAPRTLPVRAPTLKNVDASLFKNIYFSSDNKRYAQLRGEAFNLLNTPVFAAPNMSFGSTSFGVISSQANSPRQLQVALKIYF